MRFHVYIIDDREDKVDALPTFLCWLRRSYPAFEFVQGFEAPNAASSDANQIATALDDPLGVILLDAMMDSPSHRSASDKLEQRYAIVPTDLTPIHEMLHLHAGTKLAAAIVCIAQKQKSRVVYISNQEVDRNLGSDLPYYPNLAWYRQDDGLNWQASHKRVMDSVLSVFHADTALNEAVVFLIAPPRLAQGNRSAYWDHNSLQPTHGEPPTEGCQNKAVREWLGLPAIDGESAKALMYSGREGWGVNATTSGRVITGITIAKTCAKLGFDIQVKQNGIYRLPTEPAIPFLLALGNLIWQMRQCDKTHPPTKITLSRDAGQHSIRLDLQTSKRDGTSINMSEFEDCLKNTRGHETCARLDALRRARVFLHNEFKGQPAKCFLGTPSEAVIIDFDKNPKTPALLIKWNTDNL